MKKKSFNSILEDKTIEQAVEISTDFFNKKVFESIKQEFDFYLNAWPLKKALYDSIEGGKRLRAFSCLLFYKMCGGKNSDEIKNIVAGMELIHCASLVLDDELDKRDIRPDRKIPTIRGKYSPEEAMLVVALNVMYSFDLIFSNIIDFEPKKRDLIKELFVRTVSEGGMGEIEKWKFMNSRKIPSKKIYWKNLVRSSGALFFQMACKIGALTATNDKKLIDKATVIGYNLGELLQAGDDLKDIKEDLRDGFYSLGVINYYESLNSKEKNKFKEKLKRKLTERDLDIIANEIVYSKSMKKTFDEIKEKGNQIIELLSVFEESEEKKFLIRIVNYLKNRMKVNS
ncbi:MAG: polyprenyl synthetase family protein [Candidatus Diapherotrites archaeon]|nr:polyprenyl synthetase family protein [Candidatus Diapherotrites archaeon]